MVAGAEVVEGTSGGAGGHDRDPHSEQRGHQRHPAGGPEDARAGLALLHDQHAVRLAVQSRGHPGAHGPAAATRPGALGERRRTGCRSFGTHEHDSAVAREVLEETGVEVAGACYDSSQPWPFPSSLMLGFRVGYVAGEGVASDGELEDARWFTREELTEAAEGRGEVRLPPQVAIARTLIDAWLAAR